MLSLQVFKDENAPAAALLAVCIRKYGIECFETSPELLRQDIEKDYDISLSDLQADKIQAAMTLLITDLVEDQWEVFKTCVNLFSGIYDTFEDGSPNEAEYIAKGLADIHSLKDDLEGFSDEVKAYAGQVFSEYGLCKAPDVFPDAIMPEAINVCDCEEKNEALNEIFIERHQYIENYLEQLKDGQEISQYSNG